MSNFNCHCGFLRLSWILYLIKISFWIFLIWFFKISDAASPEEFESATKAVEDMMYFIGGASLLRIEKKKQTRWFFYSTLCESSHSCVHPVSKSVHICLNKLVACDSDSVIILSCACEHWSQAHSRLMFLRQLCLLFISCQANCGGTLITGTLITKHVG